MWPCSAAAGAAAKFDVTGEGGLTYSIVLTPTALTRSGGTETMNFTAAERQQHRDPGRHRRQPGPRVSSLAAC